MYWYLFLCYWGIGAFYKWWYIAVPIVVAIVMIAAIIWFAVWKHGKNEETKIVEEGKRKAEEEMRKAKEERQSLILDINQTGFWNFIYRGIPTNNRIDTNAILSEITKYPIIVDTNIWMDVDLDCFWQDVFKQCSILKRQIIIPSTVYDEIIRLRKENPSVEQIQMARLGIRSYEGKSFKARLALKRIMRFSDSGLLNIHDIKKVSNPYAYADIDIINTCEYIQNQSNIKMFSLITNDKDLIIRTRHILNEQKTGSKAITCKILSIGHTKYTENWNEYKSMLS